MSIEELREQNVLLPEDEWGKHSRDTTVPQLPLAIVLAVAIVSIAVALVGDGGLLTWIGTGTFVATLYVVTWMFDRAVLRQRQRVREKRQTVRATSSSASDATD